MDKIRFACKQCGKCCIWEGWVSLYPMDIDRISQYLGISHKKFIEEYTIHFLERYVFTDSCQTIPSLKLRRHKKGCIFLIDTKCEIHQVKPVVCKNAPFIQKIIRIKDSWDFFVKQCPGIGSGKEYSREDIEELLLEEEYIDEEFFTLLNKNSYDLFMIYKQRLPPPVVFEKTYKQTFADYLRENIRNMP